MKKILSVFLAMCILFSFTVPTTALAVTEDSAITSDSLTDTDSIEDNLNSLESVAKKFSDFFNSIIEMIKELIEKLRALFGNKGIEEGHQFAFSYSMGEHWLVCVKCGEIKDKATHSFDNGTVVEEPTCVKNGKKAFVCSVCNFTKVEKLTGGTHVETVLAGVNPTCTKDGLTQGKACSECGEILETQETIPATGHTVEILPIVPATCQSLGLTEGSRCAVCKETIVAQEVIVYTDHDYEAVKVVDPTPDVNGYTEYKCTVCGNIRKSDETSYADVWDGSIGELPQIDENVIEISTAAQLAAFAESVNSGTKYTGVTIRLVENIDLNNIEWTPIGTSSNKAELYVFDGNNKTISNLKIDRYAVTEGNYSGLFGLVKSIQEIKNLEIHNVNIKGNYRVGSVVAEGTVERLTSIKLTGDVKIYGWKAVGGIVGAGGNYYKDITVDVNEGSFINTAEINGNIQRISYDYVGGVIGQQWTKELIDVTSNIDIYGSGMAVGGIAGSGSGIYKNVHCSGDVHTLYYDPVMETVFYENTDPDGNAYGPVYYWMCNGKITGFGSYYEVSYENCTSTGTLSITRDDGKVVNSNSMYFYDVDGNIVNDSRFGGSRNSSKGDSLVTIIDNVN